MIAVKHYLFLVFRLLREYLSDFINLAKRVPTDESTLPTMCAVGENDEVIFYSDYASTNLYIQAMFMDSLKQINPQTMTALRYLVGGGMPQRALLNPYEDHEVEFFAEDDKSLNVVGAALISSYPGVNYSFETYALNAELMLDRLSEKSVYSKSTDRALVEMACYVSCGAGLIHPQVMYNKLFKRYLINLILKPIFLKPETVTALRVLSEKKSSNVLFKILYKLNNLFTKPERYVIKRNSSDL